MSKRLRVPTPASTGGGALFRAPHKKASRRVRSALAAGLSIALTGLTVTGMAAPATAATDSDFEVDRNDLEFILKQIKISENHAAGGKLLCDDRADTSWTCVPDPRLPYGLRTVDGSNNNLMPGRAHFGSAGKTFPRELPAEFKDAEKLTFDPDGPAEFGGGPLVAGVDTSYKQNSGFVSDAQPRIISNLIVDQTTDNPAAVEAAQNTPGGKVSEETGEVFIPNRSPDEGLSAPFNSWFTLFGQFFDHGLDLVSKGGSGTVAVPLQPDDPLYDDTPGARTNFLMLTRATNQPGPDKVLGTADDVKEHTNRTTPFIDQNQTYTSQPSHQVFLREYEATPTGPVPTGRLLGGEGGEGLADWAGIKKQAREILGIELDDMDVNAVPLLATDPYGRFLPGPTGFPQLVIPGDPNTLLEGNPDAPVDATPALDAGVAFLDDIAHNATPTATPDANSTSDDPNVPVTRGEYDDELLDQHFITGDGRGNENIGLTSVHHVFHSEHNRLAADIDELIKSQDAAFIAKWTDESGPWDYGERLFQAARFVTEMQYQHLVFEEFARKIQPTIDGGPLNESFYHADVDPAVTSEFANVVYRFGHSMLTDTVARKGFGTEDLPLLDAFLNPNALTDNGRLTHAEGAAAVVQGMMNQTGNGIDEFVVDTLRNKLLGLPLDLATINLARARETGVPSLQTARKVYYNATFDSSLKPYANWADFRLSMKHRESITNFVAAYGKHPTLAEAQTIAEKRAAATALVADPAFMNLPAEQSGLNDVDFWIGGLAEQSMVFGGMLGTTFNKVFEEHLENLQNGDRFYYLSRTAGLNLINQLEANSFSELVMRNTDAENLPTDGFASQDLTLDLDNLPAELPAGLLQQDGVWRWDGPEHITLHGTEDGDNIRGGDGDDALWTHGGDDRAEGGIGNDTLQGGPGNDILSDLFGDDVIHGGPGDDAINAGPGLDLLFGQSGSDFILHGQEVTQSFAGQGTDFVAGGNAGDIITGNEEEDWLEGGGGADLVQGDNALTFQNDPNGGADILFGGSGNDDHDAEGGNDVMLNNGRDRHAGMLGFDWVTHKGDPDPVDADLDVSVFQPPNVTVMRPRFAQVEGLSGWDGNDILRGQSGQADQAFANGDGHQLTKAHLAEVDGLRDLLGGGDVPKFATPFMRINQANNIIVGGPGSDIIEGRGGDDFIDGNAKLNVYLQGPNGERGDTMADFRARIFDGELSPADLTIHREIVASDDAAVDTAQYEDVRANHTISQLGENLWRVAHVDEDAGGLSSGVDILQNVERVKFADEVVDLTPDLTGGAATGTVEFSTLEPKEDEEIRVVTDPRSFSDPDGIQEETITYTWQWGDDEGEWTSSTEATGASFTPGDAEAGAPLRVVVTFIDGAGTQETITSQATMPVINVNDAPTGPVIDNTTPNIGQKLTAVDLVDADGTHNDDGDLIVKLSYQWQRGNGKSFSNIPGATEASYTVTEADKGKQLRVRVRYTDAQGTAEAPISDPTEAVPGEVAPDAPEIGPVSLEDTRATVTWSPAADGNNPLVGYVIEVYRNGTTDIVRTIDAIGPELNSTVIDGLERGATHRFRVRAVNSVGSSPWSAFSAAVKPVPAPTVLSTTPVDGATGVAPGAHVLVFFSEAITGNGGSNVKLTKVADGAEIPFTQGFTPSSNRLAVNPYGNNAGVLEDGVEYELTLRGGSSGIRSLSGVPLETTSIRFTTATAAARPTVTSSSPADGATDVGIRSNVAVFFSEAITGHGGSNVRLIKVSDGAEVPFTRGFTLTNNRLMIYPYGGSADLLEPETEYRVVLTGGPTGIRSLSGVPLESTSITFTTAPVAATPTVTSSSPEDGATGVGVGRNVAIFFSEAITGHGGSNVKLVRVSDGQEVPTTRGFNSTNNRLMLYPFGNSADEFDAGTEYQVTLTGGPGGIRSAETGRPMVTTTINFTTAP